jgi:AcrR family transcriptional regulator
MAKFTDTQRESRRQLILDAALRCFSKNGFHNTTTADIVRESGVSQGTLYLYFATKDDVIVALADDRRQGDAMLNALAQGERDPIEGLALLVELHGRSLSDPQRLDARRVGVQGWAEALRNPTVHESLVAGMAAVRREIARLIERGRQTGQFRAEVDPDAAALTLIATFQGLTLQTVLGEDFDLSAVGRLMRDMIRGALFTEAALAADTFHLGEPKERVL